MPVVADLPELFMRLERRIARLERSTGSSTPTPPEFIQLLDITGLSLVGQTVSTVNQEYEVRLKYSWSAISLDPNDPAENADTFDVYLTSYSIDGTNFTAEQATTQTEVTIGPFAQGVVVTFRVRARTIKGNFGDYSSINTTTTSDTTSPNQPSTPTVEPYLGQLMITWDGKDTGAAAMPTDFRYTEIHASTSGSTFTPTPATLVGTYLRAGGKFMLSNLTYGATYYVRLIAVDTVGNKSVASASGSGVPERLVNDDIADLAVNNAKIADLSAGKLTSGTIAALVSIVAGDAGGAHAEITDSGIRIWGLDPEGQLQLIGQFGDSGTDFLSISDVSGNVLAAITDAGYGNFQGLSSDNDFELMGQNLLGDFQNWRGQNDINAVGWLDRLPRGLIAYLKDGTAWTVTAGEIGTVELSFLAQPGRAYRLNISSMLVTYGAGANGGLRVRCTQPTASPTFDNVAASPTTTSGALGYAYDVNEAGANRGKTIDWSYVGRCNISGDMANGGEFNAGTVRILVCLFASTGTLTVYSSAWMLSVEDIGLDNPDTGIANTGSGGTTTKKTYISTWYANDSATYRGDGSKRGDTTDAYQGYYSGTNGNQKGLIKFTGNAAIGETTKTITTALSGATVQKAELFMYATHWYNNSGGTAVIGYHNYTTLPASSPSYTGNQLQSASWPKPGGRWVKLPSSWHAGLASGSIRGVVVGPGPTTGAIYYGRFASYTASTTTRPALRITYTR